MRKTMMLCGVLLAAVLAGCKTGGSGEKGSGSGGSDTSKNDSGKTAAPDMSDTMIKMHLDGQMKASYWVALHDSVSVGQLWEVSSDFGAGESVSAWQVVKMSGKGEFIIENNTGQGYVLAYRVDAWADAGQPNVKEAWIGKPGEEPKTIKVMEFKPAEGTAKPVESKARVTVDKFSDVKLGGKVFSGDVTTVEDGGNTTKTWLADNGWFNRVIRMDMNGKNVMTLKKAHFDEKAPSWLKWPK